jgi:hypothetical protein
MSASIPPPVSEPANRGLRGEIRLALAPTLHSDTEKKDSTIVQLAGKLEVLA